MPDDVGPDEDLCPECRHYVSSHFADILDEDLPPEPIICHKLQRITYEVRGPYDGVTKYTKNVECGCIYAHDTLTDP